MFAKTYKIKSTTTLKNSEKKHFVQRLQDAFPAVTAEEVRDLVPTKSTCNCLKLVVHSGETVALFAVDGVAIALETGRGLLPALPALWKLPKMIPTINIHAAILPKIVGGAPLYLPGVAVPSGGVGFPMFAAGAPLAARPDSGGGAALLGYALLSSADMLLRAQGSCMEMVCVYGDLLCREPRLERVTRPLQADAVTEDMQRMSLAPPAEEWPALGQKYAPPTASYQDPPVPNIPAETAPNAPRMIGEPNTAGEHNGQPVDTEPPAEAPPPAVPSPADPLAVPTDMDSLLRHCLLSFLSLRAKNVALPLKVNLLYKNHLIPLCPAGRTLDVKQSSYKKIGKFLDAMQSEGLLEVRETEKGVWDVTAVNLSHAWVRAHHAEEAAPTEPPTEGADYRPPEIKEVYCVTAAVQDLLQTKKGTALTAAQVRGAVAGLVRGAGLGAGARGAGVAADGRLATVLGVRQQEVVSWDAVMSGVLSRMTPATLLLHHDQPQTLIKSRLEPISMAVQTRSGNKKVTLVSNLESFGLSPLALASSAQKACGAACGVTRSPGAKADQLMLQGDQTNFVARLLIEKYGLPKKFLAGADKALNKKK